MVYKYSYQGYDNQTMARASSQNVAISLKKSVEVAKSIKGKKVNDAIDYLEKVSEKTVAVPYTRYVAEMAHRKGKGISTGGYPLKAVAEFLRLIKSAQKNASEKEMSEDLVIISASVRKGTNRYHYGRYSGRKMKSTNVEIIVGAKK